MTSDADYDTYGRPQTVTADPASAITRFGYAGEYTDPTGYLYLRARYYDPTTAQFLTRDPLEATTGNPYGYTGGNPLQFVDPLGLDWLQTLSDFSAGFGDTITFGGTREIRRLINYGVWGETDDMANECATAYTWGGYTATAADLALGGAGIVTSVRGVIRAGRLAETASAAGRLGASDLRAAAQAADCNGLTQVGRALQKHSGREGSVFSGLSSGSATGRNEQGLKVLDEILGDPGGRTEVLDRVTNFWDSTGRGARFGNDGSFMGFLEPLG